MNKYQEMSDDELLKELEKERKRENDNYWKFTRCSASRCNSFVNKMSEAAKNKKEILCEIRKRKNNQKSYKIRSIT